MSETPEVLDDWWWFLMSYWMVLFRPFQYMEEVRKIKRSRWKRFDE